MDRAATPSTTDAASITITREQIERWTRRTLTDDEIARLLAAIPNSSIPEAIADIVTQFEHDPQPDPYHWNGHTNDIGDWCEWSYKPAPNDAGDDEHRCPSGCQASTPEPDDPPNFTDCQFCGAPGGYPYCTGTYGGRLSCAEVVERDNAAAAGR